MKVSKKTAFNIKEASNQNLKASARKHYAENAQAAMKSAAKKGAIKGAVKGAAKGIVKSVAKMAMKKK
jgi:hypothetical protein